MTGLKIAVFAIAGVVFLLLLKRSAPNFAVVGEIALVAVVLLSIIPEIKTLLSVLEGFQDISSASSTAIKIMFKAFGILASGAIAADVCRDNGESAVAGVVELSVKILAISVALPVFTAVVEIASAFFNR